jgi:hypothetical protein
MAAAEVALKSPSVPLFQRENFPRSTLTLFGKEKKGRFLGEMGWK